jgi:hypothetical protein
VVGLFCYLTKLDEGIRSAYICVVIIIGADHFADLSPPIDRVATSQSVQSWASWYRGFSQKLGRGLRQRVHGQVAR